MLHMKVISCVKSIKQSVNIFVQKCNRHWTRHQGMMQPLLTGARKTVLAKAINDNRLPKKNVANRK